MVPSWEKGGSQNHISIYPGLGRADMEQETYQVCEIQPRLRDPDPGAGVLQRRFQEKSVLLGQVSTNLI